MEKLKPCPFCGGEASLFTTDEIGYLGSDRFTTKCNGCFCGTGHYAGPERAIEAWNRRPAPENKPLTNFQRVTESPEKLAQIFQIIFLNGVDNGMRKIDFGKTGGSLKFWLDWLNEPAEEE